jgi:regulatory protein
LLARRDYPSKLLRERLSEAGFEEAAAESAVADLEDARYVNDERYVEAAIAGRIARGQGPIRIALELHRQRCAKELVESLLSRDDPEWNERASALRLRRFGPAEPADARERQRQIRFLLQRGFTSAQVRAALADAAGGVEMDLDDEPIDLEDDAAED